MHISTAHPPMILCDCLNDCGDDSWIYENKCIPCIHFLLRPQEEKAMRFAKYLVLKAEFEPDKRKKK